jgi:Ca2+-binding EF-hand superfamily protein
MRNSESSQNYDYFKQIFELLDAENKGEIRYDHFINFLYKVGLSQTEIENILIKTVGYCNSYNVSLKQFLSLMHPFTNRKKIKEDALRNIFNRYHNKKGYLNIHEFKSIILSLGDEFDDNEIREYYKKANSKRNGKLDFEEFLAFWDK